MKVTFNIPDKLYYFVKSNYPYSSFSYALRSIIIDYFRSVGYSDNDFI